MTGQSGHISNSKSQALGAVLTGLTVAVFVVCCGSEDGPTSPGSDAGGESPRRAQIYDSANVLIGTTLYEYNARGLLSKKTDYDASGLEEQYWTYQYNAFDSLVEWVNYDVYGGAPTFDGKWTYEYDASHKRTREYAIYPRDTGTAVDTFRIAYYQYNYFGALGKVTYTDYVTGDTTLVERYTYDGAQRLVSMDCTEGDSTTNHVTYTYYNDGKLKLVTSVCVIGWCERSRQYTYDTQGRVATVEYLTDSGAVEETVRYEY